MTGLNSIGIPTDRCLIWPHSHAEVRLEPGLVVQINSDRAGGAYSFHLPVYADIQDIRDQGVKARLTTLLVDQRTLGVVCPEITKDTIDSATTKRSLMVYERANRLLQFMANIRPAGQEVPPIHEVFPLALARSESTTENEIDLILNHLVQEGFVNRGTAGEVRYKVTLAGHAHLESLPPGVHSNRVFVAMWFDDSMKEVYYKGIEPAIKEAGYEPTRVDQEQFLTKIDEKIIADIRGSAFVVADFTHGEDGQRGSVYYEAGFAHGLNIPVIFLCRQTEEDAELNLAFDTQQYPHILWENEEDLKEKLLQKIRAVMPVIPA